MTIFTKLFQEMLMALYKHYYFILPVEIKTRLSLILVGAVVSLIWHIYKNNGMTHILL